MYKKHKVSKLFMFGSILTNRFNDDSDVDLIVSFNKAEVSGGLMASDVFRQIVDEMNF